MEFRYCADIDIPLGHVTLPGHIAIPRQAKAIVIFTHGAGSGRNSPRNKTVADHLNDNGFGTLLFDLLTPEEDKNYFNRFDIELLTQRLVTVTEWMETIPACEGLTIGYFGASTGAAAALNAAAILPQVSAVVSRGGRPDLAMPSLPDVKAPVLLIVGSLDHDVLKMNETALNQLICPKKLEIVRGAAHLFQEEGKMQQVADLALAWFEKYLLPVDVHSSVKSH